MTKTLAILALLQVALFASPFVRADDAKPAAGVNTSNPPTTGATAKADVKTDAKAGKQHKKDCDCKECAAKKGDKECKTCKKCKMHGKHGAPKDSHAHDEGDVEGKTHEHPATTN
jgi:hypothetical protein